MEINTIILGVWTISVWRFQIKLSCT